MARKRMFDLEIINQDSFLDLPMDAKALYFLLGMEADDEGFVAPRKVIRLYGGTEDSIKLLIAKKYVIPFNTGVVVITDWKRNNWLDNRRVKPTIYQNEKAQIEYDESSEKYICLAGAKRMLRENRIEENSNIYVQNDLHDSDKNASNEEELPQKNTSNEGKSISNEEKLVYNFNLLWKHYPLKKGKDDAFKHYKAWIKGKKVEGKIIKLTNIQMQNAVDMYADENEKTDPRYIQQGGRFFNNTIYEYVQKVELEDEHE